MVVSNMALLLLCCNRYLSKMIRFGFYVFLIHLKPPTRTRLKVCMRKVAKNMCSLVYCQQYAIPPLPENERMSPEKGTSSKGFFSSSRAAFFMGMFVSFRARKLFCQLWRDQCLFSPVSAMFYKLPDHKLSARSLARGLSPYCPDRLSYRYILRVDSSISRNHWHWMD